MKIKKIFLFILLVILVLAYTMLISYPSYDEIWNYGFAYNITTGLIPYRDFNILVTPLWSYLVALFIKIFGNYLISMHLLNAIVITTIFFLLYKLLGKKAFIVSPLILLFPTPTYNIFSIFLFVLFIYLKTKNIQKNSSILFGLLISFLFLTKQTIGGALFLVEFFYTKDKKKYLASFTLPILILCTYLIANNAFYNFLDYCFLGMLDFGSKNSNLTPYLFAEISLCILLIFLYQKYHYPELLYVLSFQVVVAPIFDYYHFVLGAEMIIFIFLLKFNYKSYRTKYFIIYSIVLLLISNFSIIPDYIWSKNNFLYGRNVGKSILIFEETSSYIKEQESSYDKVYIISVAAYLLRLNMNEEIDKYDMTLNGNMGYKGYLKYIEEIDKYCKSQKCLFLVEPLTNDKYDQNNQEIRDYISNNYNELETYTIFKIYTTEK